MGTMSTQEWRAFLLTGSRTAKVATIASDSGGRACAGNRVRSGTPWAARTTPWPAFAPTSSTVSISASATIPASSALVRWACGRSTSGRAASSRAFRVPYKLGGYWDTEPLTNFDTGRRERGTGGFYVAFDRMLWQEPHASSGQGLYLWTAFHWAPSDMNPQDRFGSFGFVYPGLVPGRDRDIAGLYGAYGHFSADQRAAQRRAGQPGQVYEAVLEANYRIHVLPWFYLQPDIQGIINPGAAHQIADALVLAMQFGVPFW